MPTRLSLTGLLKYCSGAIPYARLPIDGARDQLPLWGTAGGSTFEKLEKSQCWCIASERDVRSRSKSIFGKNRHKGSYVAM